MCIVENCNIHPCYNYENEKKAKYCSLHKSEKMVDVKHKTCIHADCKTLPTYNYENEKNTKYCSLHKLEKMVNVKDKTCIHADCKTLPTYNYENEKNAKYCSLHKSEKMIDVKNKTCNNSWCKTYVTNKYDGYCLFCFVNMFPDKPVSRNYKTKETTTVEYIKTNFSNMDWVTDNRIKDGCSRRRPDIFLDLGYQVIIVEIDENQHIDYDCSCENKRIMELSQDVGHRPIVFIRFNPDEYAEGSITVTSCWNLNKLGVCVVKKTKQQEWENRLNSLQTQISYWINPENKTDKVIEIIQLFYDK